MSIDTGTVGSYYFWIHWINSYGTYVVSEPITVSIKYNCSYDLITHNKVAPVSTVDYPPAELTFMYDHISSNKSNVNLNYTIGEYKYMQVNMTSRLVNNASAYCPLYNYTIAKIVDANTDQVYKVSTFSPLHIEMTWSGFLQLKKMNSPWNFYIYVNATNGVQWLYQEDQPMLLLNYTVPWKEPPNFAPIFTGQVLSAKVNVTVEPSGLGEQFYRI